MRVTINGVYEGAVEKGRAIIHTTQVFFSHKWRLLCKINWPQYASGDVQMLIGQSRLV
jgi:hypothetical protein